MGGVVPTPEIDQNLLPESAKTLVPRGFRELRRRLNYLEHCWSEGVNAPRGGFCPPPPYYEDLQADLYWFAGFDGFGFETKVETQPGHRSSATQSHLRRLRCAGARESERTQTAGLPTRPACVVRVYCSRGSRSGKYAPQVMARGKELKRHP